jgi:transcription elongation factor S-II
MEVRTTIQTKFSELADKYNVSKDIMKEIEIGIFNWTIRYAKSKNVVRSWVEPLFRKLYMEKARHILTNLDGDTYIKNNRLIERLIFNEFKPVEIAEMQPERLYPEMWKEHVQAITMREEKALKPKIVPKTDRFRCKMCKKNECSFYEMQIRSGDEASTQFILCLNCGHKWRING